MPAAPNVHLDDERAIAAAKLDALVSTLTAAAAGWPGWEPTPPLLLAIADLAASARRHLAPAA